MTTIQTDYILNNPLLGAYPLQKRVFNSTDDMHAFVQDPDYLKKGPLCFAMSWDDFDLPNEKFAMNMHWYSAWMPSTSLNQTSFEYGMYDADLID
jgi:hypothetical protein